MKDYDCDVVPMQIGFSVIWTDVIFPGELTFLILQSRFSPPATISYFVSKKCLFYSTFDSPFGFAESIHT